MNYQRIYDQLITRAKTRIPPQGYIEHHHIVPRCMNGSNDKSNIAILTPEEHFVAHVLLVKIHPEIPGLIVAVSRMCKGKGRKRRKLYGWLRRRHSEYMKQRMKGQQSGANNSQFGTIWITNGTDNKKIVNQGIIPYGWKKGRNMPCLETVKHCRECNRALGKKTRKWFCQYCKSIHIQRSRALKKNTMLITNGVATKFVSKDSTIPTGWRKGRHFAPTTVHLSKCPNIAPVS